MKILVLSHMYPQQGHEHYGLFVHEPLCELARRGHEIRVVAPLPRTPPGLAALRGDWRRLAALPARRELDGIPIDHPRYLLWPRRIDFAGAAARMARAVLALDGLEGFDLLHAHAGLPDGAAARRVAAQLGLPYLVTSHGSDVLRMAGWSRRCHEEIRAAFALAAAVVYPSSLARRRAEARGLPVANARVIWNGFDAERFTAAEAPSARDGPLRLITVANLVPSKRIDLLLRACAGLGKRGVEAKLRVVGRGEDERALKQLAADLDLDVEWIPALDRDELAAALRASDVFALPAEREAFGIVYLEAMASGLAVIGVASEGIADLIEHGQNGLLVPAGEESALSDAIAELAGNGELRRRLGAEAIRQARGLGWPRHADELAGLYEQIRRRSPREQESALR